MLVEILLFSLGLGSQGLVNLMFLLLMATQLGSVLEAQAASLILTNIRE